MVNTKGRNVNLKPPKIAPKMVNCFRCNKEFGIKWVTPYKRYSLKNSWAYWTSDEKEGDKKICDNCLIHIYRNEKKFFLEKVKDPKRRNRIGDYLTDRTLVAS